MLRRASARENRWLEEHFGAAHLGELRSLAEPRRAASRGNVVLLHGILGSHLGLSGAGGRCSTIWISPWSLVKGRFAKLRLNENGGSQYRVEPTGTLKRYYGKPLLHLAQRWDVRAFAYDWRRSIRESADRLARAVHEWFGREEPVHLVAHSMGGLVARAFTKAHAERWSRGGRLVMLGTPNRGSYAIPQLFAGFHSLLSVLALIDAQHKKDDLRRIVASFEGAAEMLPFGETALFDQSRYGIGAPSERLLGRVRATQEWLSSAIDPARMSYIGGSGKVTAVGMRDLGRLDAKDGYHWSRAGDGTVPHSLGMLEGVPAYFTGVEHGKLPGNGEVLAAVEEILETGHCTRLASSPANLRGGEEVLSLEDDGLDTGPSEKNPVDALMAAFAGIADAPEPARRVKVVVRRGILEGATDDAIAVSYYAAIRPRYFTGHPMLGELFGRGVLSGELGAPFFVPGEPPLLLMCLGPVGRFGATELALYVRQLCWTASNLGLRRLATALTGCGRGNLTQQQAAEIWRRGIAESGLDQVTFFESDGDRCRALAAFFGVTPSPAAGPRSSPPPGTTPHASRLSIERTPAGIGVALLTGEASMPEREIQLDFGLATDINLLLAEATDPADRQEWAECLARLILPNELRKAFDGPEPMVIACDIETAALHWEMLRSGSVSRQLKSSRAPLVAPPPGEGRVLIVADTCLEAPLPQAREEAERLAALLSSRGLEVTALLGPERASRAAVLRELLLRRYDVLHFAGHCRYAADSGPGSGWLFSGGTVFGANELHRVDRVPPFVFSNACDSGRLPARPGETASFAESFFARGVQNFICTSWPVGDAEAAAFAAAVYENADNPIHIAMAEAGETVGVMPGRWQHYGNPFYRILGNNTFLS